MMSKKGSEGTLIVASMFLLLLIVFLAFIFFKIGIKAEKEVIDSVRIGDRNVVLLNILKTEFDNKEGLADILVDNYKKNDFNEFNEKSGSVINKAYSSSSINGFLVIKSMPQNEMIFESEIFESPFRFYDPKKVSSVNVPVDDKNYLEVNLYEF